MTGEEWLFTGRGRLMERPQGVYAELFAKQGVFFARENAGIRVCGPLPAGVYRLPGNVSSQFVTGLLLALPLAEGDSILELASPLESADYVALTLQTMEAFGARAEERRGADGGVDGYMVKGGQRYRPAEYTVEGDWSQAAFFLCAAALGRDVAVAGLDPASRQGDRRVVGILERMGVSTSWKTGSLSPAAGTRDERKTIEALLRVAVSAGGLRGAEIDARDIPDIVPPLAALACFAKGVTRITGAGRLRIKESDRLSALAQELAKLGADISEEEDGLTIRGRVPGLLPGGNVDAHGDHRIAMAMAVAAVGCGGPVRLAGAESVAKSYPGFWDDFEGK
jgi:3-phosphoshikimate 1-carboxyvinyltransferase